MRASTASTISRRARTPFANSNPPVATLLAVGGGATLVLSVNSTNRDAAADWGCRVVVVPDDPATLGQFAQDSHCDLLAVDLGSAHKQEDKTARLDFARLQALAAATPLPLVLHGASSVPEDELAHAAALGVAKVNLATDLTLAFTGAVRDSLSGGAKDPRTYLAAGRSAMQVRAEHYLRVLGSAGRA